FTPSGCGASARCVVHEDPDEEVESMTATSARPAEGVATAGEPASPPVRRVQARAPLTEDSLLARGKVTPGSADAAAVARLLEAEREESRRYARQLRDLAAFWIDDEDPHLEREEHSLAVGIALRTTTSVAALRIEDAHTAVAEMPRTFERLASGEMPREWHQRALRALRDRKSTRLNSSHVS